jgi:DNA (cytosine-5)-methyltransferase 1
MTPVTWAPNGEVHKNAGNSAPVFVDVFAGAGGLSLGLMRAGLRGLFAVEHEANAFETLKANLIEPVRRGLRYAWPEWLSKEPWEISKLLAMHAEKLDSLRGSVDLLAGGPPCQGFSHAGRRRRNDPRNRLFKLYVDMARVLRPTFLVLENVPGIAIEFGKEERRRINPRRLGRPAKPFSDRIITSLSELGYKVFILQERAAEFGVPQWRPRYLILGILEERAYGMNEAGIRERLLMERAGFLAELGLPAERPVTVRQAISDLETTGTEFIECPDSRGFRQAVYRGPRTHYQQLMHEGLDEAQEPNSVRLVNHRPETIARFKRILAACRKGVVMRPEERDRFGVGKISLTPLHPDQPSHTLTSLPDDFLHYAEPRILTVREYARLQSFPDWFEFRGKYTTGGIVRKYECPRYTQVANAVPPLLAEVIGRVITRLASELNADPARQAGQITEIEPIAVAV